MKKMSSQVNVLPRSVLTIRTKNRALQITREGGGFIFIILTVGIGAILTSNNLLYLVLAMCCSFLIVSGVLSELTLKKIRIKTTLPASMYAQDVFPLNLTVTNGKKYFSSYSLHITIIPVIEGRLEGNTGIYLFHIPPKGSMEKTLLMKVNKRGPMRLRGLQVSTGFPFGFFYKTKFLQEKMEALVFPAIRKVHLPSFSHASAEGQGVLKNQGEELFALREYREGDSLNAVH